LGFEDIQILAMAQKNETPVLVLALLITIGVLGGLFWWFTRNSVLNLSKSGNSTPGDSSPTTGGKSSQSSGSTPSNDLSSVPLTSTKGVDYTDLRDDLQSHNWKRANVDTTEALLKAFGPDSDQTGHVAPQEAAHPPCQDLKTVDQLWFKASNGNLGFTAQRQILKQARDYRQAYNQMQWQRPGGEWLIQYIYDGHREHFKPGYEPDYGNPDQGHLPTFERGYNFNYSFDGSLAKCGL